MSEESKSKGLKLYNTLSRQKEDFVPIAPDDVRMYVCGPTVYDYAHIGNARPVIVFDVLYRMLRHVYGEEHVTYVRNITDVDDKINARAAEDYPGEPLNNAIARVTAETAAQYERDMSALGNLPPDVEPRATDHIEEMKRMIAALIEKGNAYVAEGHVLFHVNSWTDAAGNALYGKLSQRSLDEMIAGARVDVAPYKKEPMDFVLWKPSRADEPGWDSDWGRGRPGWHIECSAMAKKHLGDVFDIHGGGIDLVFPHHENEIAQSRCADGTEQMAKVWMHNGFLQVEGEKMSKSLGNFFTVHELLETDKFGGRKWPGAVLRLAMLMTHYRKPIDFTVERLQKAEKTLNRWVDIKKLASDFDWAALNARLSDPLLEQTFVEFLLDDLNTPAAIARLQSLAKKAENGATNAAFEVVSGLTFLGIELDDFVASQDLTGILGATDPEIQQLVDARNAAREKKNFAEADRLRDQLVEQGVVLKDFKHPETGKLDSEWEAKR